MKRDIEFVSLEELGEVAVDMMAVVEDDINESYLWESDTNYEQYLVMGTVQEVGSNHYYRQGVGDDLEGKKIQQQDRWLDSLD